MPPKRARLKALKIAKVSPIANSSILESSPVILDCYSFVCSSAVSPQLSGSYPLPFQHCKSQL